MNKKSPNEKRRYTCNVVSHWRIFWSVMEERAFRIEYKNWRNVLCRIKISTVLNMIRWLLMTYSHMRPVYQLTYYSSCLIAKISDLQAPQHLGHANKKSKLCFAGHLGVESTDYQCILQTMWRWYKKRSCIMTSACLWPPLHLLDYRNIILHINSCSNLGWRYTTMMLKQNARSLQ